jgi:hypothetical protein
VVTIEILEETPEVDAAGAVIKPAHGMAGRSEWVTVR